MPSRSDAAIACSRRSRSGTPGRASTARMVSEARRRRCVSSVDRTAATAAQASPQSGGSDAESDAGGARLLRIGIARQRCERGHRRVQRGGSLGSERRAERLDAVEVAHRLGSGHGRAQLLRDLGRALDHRPVVPLVGEAVAALPGADGLHGRSQEVTAEVAPGRGLLEQHAPVDRQLGVLDRTGGHPGVTQESQRGDDLVRGRAGPFGGHALEQDLVGESAEGRRRRTAASARGGRRAASRAAERAGAGRAAKLVMSSSRRCASTGAGSGWRSAAAPAARKSASPAPGASVARRPRPCARTGPAHFVGGRDVGDRPRRGLLPGGACALDDKPARQLAGRLTGLQPGRSARLRASGSGGLCRTSSQRSASTISTA